jgi:hypothetical protein
MPESQSLDQLITEVNADAGPTPTPRKGTALSVVDQPWSPHLVVSLAGGFLLFGVLVCAAMAFLMLRGRRSTDLLRAFSLPLIIVSAVFLVVTGYSAQQISSVIGLLGAIAGYILGSNERAPPKPDGQGET